MIPTKEQQQEEDFWEKQEQLRLEAEAEAYRNAMDDEYYAEMQRQEEEWRDSQFTGVDYY